MEITFGLEKMLFKTLLIFIFMPRMTNFKLLDLKQKSFSQEPRRCRGTCSELHDEAGVLADPQTTTSYDDAGVLSG